MKKGFSSFPADIIKNRGKRLSALLVLHISVMHFYKYRYVYVFLIMRTFKPSENAFLMPGPFTAFLNRLAPINQLRGICEYYLQRKLNSDTLLNSLIVKIGHVFQIFNPTINFGAITSVASRQALRIFLSC